MIMLTANQYRYLPVLPAQRRWGLFVVDCGYTTIAPGESYPPRGHPRGYDFDWKTGRTLHDYHVLYITRGRGVFEAQGVGRRVVESGDVFLLFPGVWHRYRPDPKTGWDEHWVGFNGAQADLIMRPPFFVRRKPILRIGLDEGLRQRMTSLVDDLKANPCKPPFHRRGTAV
jgi:mannose-6-phosphate isomerase-like protein (cupin superfamily)